MKKAANKRPDYNDPFAPERGSNQLVKCLHCGDVYPESEVYWDSRQGLWVCKNWPKCNGAGVGFDIFHEETEI